MMSTLSDKNKKVINEIYEKIRKGEITPNQAREKIGLKPIKNFEK